ncbi:MAG TPA: alpha/beta hydrolase [Anaeromyxobacteraceae bacterium]|nr:alpha/beta hydrolase [Anaeromyxobacteraceae bacterium]
MLSLSRPLVVISFLSLLGCATAPATPSQAAPNAERISMVAGRAGRLRVSDGGTGGVPVVFLHGLGSDLEAWRAQLVHLRSSRRAIAYDQRGHGGSDDARDGVYTIAALVEDLDAVASSLGLNRFYLVGHSMSGEILTAYAAAHPERLAGLVYADALGDLTAIPKPQIEQMLQQESSPAFGKQQEREIFSRMLLVAQPSTRERVLTSLDRLTPSRFAALRRSMVEFRARPLLRQFRGPRLVIEAAGPPNPALFSTLDPTASRTQLAGVSHWLMMDDPDGFNRTLDAFIRD